jgi:signal transduction histidine kinase
MGTLFRPLIRARTWKETLHLLIDLPLGIAWFTIIVTGIALGAGLAITFLGVVVLFATLQFVRVVSAIERARAKALLGADIANPFVPLSDIDGWWPRLKAVLADAALWKGVVYCVVALPVGILTFTVAITFWSIALGGVTAPIWATIEAIVGANDPHGWAYVGITAASFVAGLIFLVATPWVVHGLAAMDRGLIRGLLGADRNAQLRRRVTQLEVSKTASLDVAEAERTRIERDLHDGVQPRLVVAAMDLGLVRKTRPSKQSQSCASWCAASIPRCSPIAASTRRCRRSPRVARCRSPCRSTSTSGRRRRSSRPRTSSSPSH